MYKHVNDRHTDFKTAVRKFRFFSGISKYGNQIFRNIECLDCQQWGLTDLHSDASKKQTQRQEKKKHQSLVSRTWYMTDNYIFLAIKPIQGHQKLFFTTSLTAKRPMLKTVRWLLLSERIGTIEVTYLSKEEKKNHTQSSEKKITLNAEVPGFYL